MGMELRRSEYSGSGDMIHNIHTPTYYSHYAQVSVLVVTNSVRNCGIHAASMCYRCMLQKSICDIHMRRPWGGGGQWIHTKMLSYYENNVLCTLHMVVDGAKPPPRDNGIKEKRNLDGCRLGFRRCRIQQNIMHYMIDVYVSGIL